MTQTNESRRDHILGAPRTMRRSFRAREGELYTRCAEVSGHVDMRCLSASGYRHALRL